MSREFKVVYFDMDGTLVRNTNSVEYLCSLANALSESKVIDEKEKKEEITWIDADYFKASLLKGLKTEMVASEFDAHIEVIDGIKEVLSEFHGRGMKCILVTAGPLQVANEIVKRYNFDEVYGSNYEVIDEAFTGSITSHMMSDGKLKVLLDYCAEVCCSLDEVIAIGDSDSDISVFDNVGLSIAINYSTSVEGRADKYIRTDDIQEILNII